MSSITSATAASMGQSPLSRLQAELASEVSSGAISSGDQSALSSALSDIDSAMQSGVSESSGSRPSPAEMKAKISSLIAGEVKDGKLTADQAAELNNVFAQAFKGGPGGGQGPGGAGGAGGGGGASQSSSSTDPADTNGDGTVSAAEQAAYDAKYPNSTEANSSDTSGSSTKSDTTKLLQDFVKLLQDSKNSSSSYSSNGDNLASAIQSLIVNFQT